MPAKINDQKLNKGQTKKKHSPNDKISVRKARQEGTFSRI